MADGVHGQLGNLALEGLDELVLHVLGDTLQQGSGDVMSESVAGQLDEVHLLENVWEDFRVDEAADESSDGFVVVDVTGELLVAAEERQTHGGEW